MIVARVSDAYLLRAVRFAARPDEDVVSDLDLLIEAIDTGFPRLVVRSEELRLPSLRADLPVLDIDGAMLRRWDAERRSAELPEGRVDFVATRLRALIAVHALERTWVDRALADLGRAAGGPLPGPMKAFARRILEFPAHYTNLHPLAESCGMSRGALKARFRRRGLSSPYTYQRWLRIMAVAEVLSDRSVTIAMAGRRTGFTSDGNLCRMMATVCGMTPTELRTVHGWNRLLLSFAWQHLTSDALEAWSDLDDVFVAGVA